MYAGVCVNGEIVNEKTDIKTRNQILAYAHSTLGCRDGIRTRNPQLMRLLSYLCSTLRYMLCAIAAPIHTADSVVNDGQNTNVGFLQSPLKQMVMEFRSRVDYSRDSYSQIDVNSLCGLGGVTRTREYSSPQMRRGATPQHPDFIQLLF